MTNDLELKAMTQISEALTPLETDGAATARVLTWASARFGSGAPPPIEPTSAVTAAEAQSAYRDAGDLLHASGATSGPTRALAIAYWLQTSSDGNGWSGAELNDTLKNLGHGLANVTVTLNGLMSKKPALVMQVSKSGRSQQARKTYRLTAAGLDAAERMLSGEETS